MVKKVKRYNSSYTHHRAIWDITCHMGSHSVTCHPTQVNSPRLTTPQPERLVLDLTTSEG